MCEKSARVCVCECICYSDSLIFFFFIIICKSDKKITPTAGDLYTRFELSPNYLFIRIRQRRVVFTRFHPKVFKLKRNK